MVFMTAVEETCRQAGPYAGGEGLPAWRLGPRCKTCRYTGGCTQRNATDEVRVEHKKQESIEIKKLKMKSERRKIKAHKWEKT